MTAITKFRELHVQLRDGVKLVIEVSSADEIRTALDRLEKDGLIDSTSRDPKPAAATPKTKHAVADLSDSPESRVAVHAEVDASALRSKNILAFKDGIPQLLRPSSFPSISDATLILIFAVEAGLKRNSVSFDEFKALFDGQNIKSGSALSMLLNNLKNAGYVDKNAYGADRTIRLTAKGEKKAIEVLKAQCA
jgi:predicted MarR family transcription regulator